MSEIEQASNQRKQLSRADFLRIAGAAGAGVAAIVVGKNPTPAKAAGKKTRVDTPLIS